MMRYPTTTVVCKNCLKNIAMYNTPYCGRCDELLENPQRHEKCSRCGAPDGVIIARSLAHPATWTRCVGGSSMEPGFGRSRKSQVLKNGLCRFCNEHNRLGDEE